MIRVCILGNSHVAAFKTTEAEIAAAHPDMEASFFGVPYPQIDACASTEAGAWGLHRAEAEAVGLNWRPTVKQVQKINGRTSVSADEYDAAYLVGRDVRMREILHLLATTDVEGFADRGRANLMSRAAFRAIIADLAAQAFPGDLAHLGRRGRAACAIMPYLSASCLTDDRPRYDDIRALAAAPADLGAVMDMIDEIIAARCDALGLTYLAQRRETVAHEFLTAADYSVGSRGLRHDGAAHDEQDYRHMNGAFALLGFEDFAAFARAGVAGADVTLSKTG